MALRIYARVKPQQGPVDALQLAMMHCPHIAPDASFSLNLRPRDARLYGRTYILSRHPRGV